MKILPLKAASFYTIRTRLTLWNMGVLALVLLALGGMLRWTVQENLVASVDRDLATRVHRLRRGWAHRLPNPADRGAWPRPLRDWPRRPPSPGGAPGPSASSQAARGYGADRRNPGRSATVGRGDRHEENERRPNMQAGDPRRGSPPGDPRGGNVPGAERRQAEGGRPAEGGPPTEQWRIFDLQGKPLFPNGQGPWDKQSFDRAVHGEEVYKTVHTETQDLRVFSAPLRHDDQVVGIVQVGYSLADVERALNNLNTTFLMLLPLALAAAWTGGMFLTGRMLRPVREVTKTAARIRAEDLSRRLPVHGRDEFSELAATFNEMLSRLEQSFEQQRRFTADASHELRTPLTVIKANTSLALSRGNTTGEQKRVLEAVDKAAGLMNSIVQDLLLLARSDSGQLELKLRPTQVHEVLEAAIECVQREGGATIHTDISDPTLRVQGDIGHLTRLFVNLLDNAMQHTPPEGTITISALQEGPAVVITVTDTGSGIAPEHLPHLCERFYRVDKARARAHGGTGLGLAICQSIVQAHHGTLGITSAPGMGTSVRVTLPV